MNESQEFRHILVLEDRKGRRIISLEDDNYTLGRDSHNSIVIYDYQVSRIHATLVKIKDQENNDFSYLIIDGDLQGNRSTNGLVIGGKATIEHELKHGEMVRFASEAKANYYIIPKDSGIDLFNPDDLGNISITRSSVTENAKQTIIAKPVENIPVNNQDQEELIRLASFPELSPNPIIEIDWDGNITYINPAATIKFDTIYEEKNNHPILAGLLSEYNNRQGNLFLREVKIGTEVFEQYVHYLSEKKLIRSYIFDFTKRKQIEASLKESEARYKSIVRQTSEGIFLAYANNKRIIEANAAYCRLLGYTDEEIAQLTVYNVIVNDIQDLNQDLDKILENKEDFVGQYIHRTKDGSLINLESCVSLISYRGKDMFCFLLRNIDNRKQLEDGYKHNTFYNSLTNLPNKNLFNEHFNIAIANAQRHQYLMSIIIIEIENLEQFHEVEDHHQLEKFLKNFAEGFKSCLRSGDLASHWEDNKFVGLLSRINGSRDSAKIAKRMSETLDKYLDTKNEKIRLKLNIAIVVYPLDGEDQLTLMKNVLLSLEQNKNSFQGNYGITDYGISAKTASVLKLENLISNAIKEQQFFLCYQPQINIYTKKITGIEALLRWQHPELGQVTPRHFIKIAEDTNLMIPIGKWVLYTACMQAKAWLNKGLCNFPIAINISPRQFQQSNLIELIEKILGQTGLPPSQLELEITENCLTRNYQIAGPILQKLATLGVRICLDDFGTGNTSLGYIEQFNFNTIKIGQELMTEYNNESKQNAMISAIVTIAHGFSVRVVAEGVEKLEQVELLRNVKCDEIQGYLFSRPLIAQDATNFLSRGNDLAEI